VRLKAFIAAKRDEKEDKSFIKASLSRASALVDSKLSAFSVLATRTKPVCLLSQRKSMVPRLLFGDLAARCSRLAFAATRARVFVART